MNVLIVEGDDLLAEVFASALAEEGIPAEVIADDEAAIAACQPDEPQVVITSINRAPEDMKGRSMVAAMRDRCPRIAALFMAAIWPVKLRALGMRERLLPKPVPLPKFVETVQELLAP
jgi:DNA-binding NtrC family response regulator